MEKFLQHLVWYEFLPYIYSGKHFPHRDQMDNVNERKRWKNDFMLDLKGFSDIIENDVF